MNHNDNSANYSTITNFELVRSGQLRSVRIGRSIRIPRDALVEYLQLAS